MTTDNMTEDELSKDILWGVLKIAQYIRRKSARLTTSSLISKSPQGKLAVSGLLASGCMPG